MDRRNDRKTRSLGPEWAKALRMALAGIAPFGVIEALIDRVEERA